MIQKLIIALLICVPVTTAYGKPIRSNEVKDAERYLEENHIEVPEEIEELCDFYGNKYDIAPELLEAVIWRESRFKVGAINADRTCVGLMQINTEIHADRMSRLKVRNIFDPAGNIKVGTDFLGELLEDHDVEVALMLYNGDSKAYKAGYISSYAESVLKVSEALERVHNK